MQYAIPSSNHFNFNLFIFNYSYFVVLVTHLIHCCKLQLLRFCQKCNYSFYSPLLPDVVKMSQTKSYKCFLNMPQIISMNQHCSFLGYILTKIRLIPISTEDQVSHSSNLLIPHITFFPLCNDEQVFCLAII